LRKFGKKWVGKIGHHKTENATAPGFECSGRKAGAEPNFVGASAHPFGHVG
jgi:hypothetical protein